MNKITLELASIDEIITLQLVLQQYVTRCNETIKVINRDTDLFLENVLAIDQLQPLFLRLRNKTEKRNELSKKMKVSLSYSEAILLMQCCNKITSQNEHNKYVLQKVVNIIHPQLISI